MTERRRAGAWRYRVLALVLAWTSILQTRDWISSETRTRLPSSRADMDLGL